MKVRSKIRIVRTAILIAVAAGMMAAQKRMPSPDGKLYAVEEDGPSTGKGEEIGRFGIFTAGGNRVSVIHVWVTEPDGTGRVGIRGCEWSGWIDSTRFYCEGSVNPSLLVYRWFDATSGKELGETYGGEFTWSPDHKTLANFGNVPHFMAAEDKSDSLDVGTHVWPSEGDPDRHLFRSSLSWSPDSKFVAVVDHQCLKGKGLFLEMVEAATGKRTEHRPPWPDEADEWPPDHDFDIEWTAAQVIVRHEGKTQSFAR